MFDQIKSDLEKHFPPKLVVELLEAYRETKHNFYIGGLRLSEVEGGRFCEAAFRVLEHAAFGSFTALGTPIDTDKLIIKLSNEPKGKLLDSIRLHIPRALRVVYDVRNNRDAAHLADGIDPNVQDATLVISVLDWVLAEFVRIYHGVPAKDAQAIIESLVERKVPAVEDFDGFIKVLRPSLGVSDYVLLILFARSKAGASFKDIETWVQPKMRSNLRRTLARLTDELALLHEQAGRYFITKRGIAEVDQKKLHQFEE
jgi:hypothetical protein